MNVAISKESFLKALSARRLRENILTLVVEDQKFSRLFLKNFLAKNYDVIDVADGEAALAEYVQNAPDIVFLDIELPGVDGHQVASLIRKLDQDAYIVMVTANNFSSDVEKAMNEGANGFIVKPFTKEKILDSIEHYISQQN